jgi:GTP cyclohydrolase II
VRAARYPAYAAENHTKADIMSSLQTGTFGRVASTRLPTRWGFFDTVGFARRSPISARPETALAIMMGDLSDGAPLLHLQAQCFAGEVFGSLRCDCHSQLELAMETISVEGRGLVVYEHREGRGIGLMTKLEPCELQDAGLETVDADHARRLKADRRDFSLPAQILLNLGVRQVRLLSNNPRKVAVLADAGIAVVQLVGDVVLGTRGSAYLQAEKEKMGHIPSPVSAKTGPGREICVRCDLVGWRTRCPICADDYDRSTELAGSA